MKQVLSLAVFTIFAGCVVNSDRDATERVGEAALAAVSRDVSVDCDLNGLVTTTSTSEMPLGWFQSNSVRTPINIEWSAPSTNCQPAAKGWQYTSDGTFHPVYSTTQKLLGYSWSANHDLIGMENHWHHEVNCAGLATVVGCSEARTISYTLSVGGACTLAGGTCVDTDWVVLPATHDLQLDVVPTNCPTDDADDDDNHCGYSLGACISHCQQSTCTNGGSDCHHCCECNCKEYLHSLDDDCHGPQTSCDPACFELPD